MKLLTVIGARPQFIKAATVSRQIALRDDISEVIVHTGQHYDANMSDVFFEELNIPKPDHHLGIGGGSHGAMTGRQLEAIEAVLLEEKPDWVLVYGDTNSTLAAALAAVKLHIPIAHVEAGLRSFNRQMPEEINRIVTDNVSDLLFAPTEMALRNLRREGHPESGTHLVGDVMYDAALYYRERARMPGWFDKLGVSPGGYILATTHRAENTDSRSRLTGILQGLSEAGLPVILPLHPRTRSKMDEFFLSVSSDIYLVDPVSYLEMVWLESNARSIATDSGGVQKEAFFYGKPCVTMRDQTEWVELVECGWNTLVSADPDQISAAIARNNIPRQQLPLYGRGDAARRIIEELT